eukprot:gnl/MRDRNA2_/MRDRNA2_284818_c0_seq1.p1 gnl/MRDRNA2_/MRDRNA2_284818_c0~~gnl/MRDRNA2_/MRDRNA2_284818_c0_seq1.p1  ORF type:complete len:264 (+),score=63.12 gnl/MRDRNA2_/MRDRNA2_284818_c0_seq1:120-794(+)
MPQYLRDRQKLTRLLKLVSQLAKLSNQTRAVMLLAPSLPVKCMTCFREGTDGVETELELIHHLLEIDDMYDKAGMVKFSQLPQVQNASLRVVNMMMKHFQNYGVAGATASEVHQGLVEECKDQLKKQFEQHPLPGWQKWDKFGLASKVLEVLDQVPNSKWQQELQSCIDGTKSFYALEQLNTQFIEQLSEGLAQTEEDGRTLRAVLEERVRDLLLEESAAQTKK